MGKPLIKPTKNVVPIIYAYTTPEIARHDGCTKLGYTEQDVDTRIQQQARTVDVEYKPEWSENAVYAGTNEVFSDHVFHAYLVKDKIKRLSRLNEKTGKNEKTEWFEISPEDAYDKLSDFRKNRGILKTKGAMPYQLRAEQLQAVKQTKAYFEIHENKQPEYLWNAKPRFGKTLAAYDLCKNLGARRVLIVTNRPAIATSWYDDYEKFLGDDSNYCFISSVDSLKDRPFVITRDQYKPSVLPNCIEFVSLQDLKGSLHFGGQYDKLEHVTNIEWDVLIIDEAHEGIDTYKTDTAFNRIKRRFTLHLSGTPFKALANDKFSSDAIYNWTYVDEQQVKSEWNDVDNANPYATLPKLNLFTYKMSDIVFDRVKAGVDISGDGDNDAYAFDLNEFFKTNEKDKFVHDKDIDTFLDALTLQSRFPFSTDVLRNDLRHTLWVLNYVSSAKALAAKLEKHSVFKDYKIVLAAGDGRIANDTESDDVVLNAVMKKSYDRVVDAIKHNDKTITLSVGQLTTGITIPEWTAVMMLSNVQSPALYIQTAFRAQNPCLFQHGTERFRKENAYVFDFDPARTLTIVEKFANDLNEDTANGRGDKDVRKQHVRELLNFFPVYGEDDAGEMIELDAGAVLSIPHKIHASEVVKHGFMSNFLFCNIGGIFSAPPDIVEILNKLEPVKEPAVITSQTRDDLSLNDDGDVDIPQETIVGIASDVFGDKLYGTMESELGSVISDIQKNTDISNDDVLSQLKDAFSASVTTELINTAKSKYGGDMTKSTQATVDRTIKNNTNAVVEKHYGDYSINKQKLENERKKDLEQALTTGDIDAVDIINKQYDDALVDADVLFETSLGDAVHDIIADAGKIIVKAVETDKKEKVKKTFEDKTRDHLRGFSRTIPSFLMAYGDENTTLASFDSIVPDDVFKDVTGISLDDFRRLRDGGSRIDDVTGENINFSGFFDQVVFDDSTKLFLEKRQLLSNYFEPNATEDIFDYIPPQKTNQIYTPKAVVKQMVDLLVQEDPECFDNPYATFVDLYMKSGLYVTEIVKRLYQSDAMIAFYPDRIERLQHIFEKQVYGLSPTEIIHAIATRYILGFSAEIPLKSTHFKCFDVLSVKQDENFEVVLDGVFA